MIEQQIIYETLPKFCSHCNVLGHLVETCIKYAKRSNVSNVVGGHVSVANSVRGKDALPAEDVNADGKWETVKKKQKSNWRPKKNMAESVSGATAKAASGMADTVIDITPRSGAAARVASGVTDKAASGVVGIEADIAPLSGVASMRADIALVSSVAGKAASGMVDTGVDTAPVSGAPARAASGMPTRDANGAVGMGKDLAPVIGAVARAVNGAAGVKSDCVTMHGTTDRAAGVDPLMAAWAISGIIMGADSGVANGTDIVDAAVVTGTEIVGAAVVASVEPSLGANGRPKNHANRNSSKGKHIVEDVQGVTTRKGSKSKSSSSGHSMTLPTNPAL
ncbi:hypothetical protein OIU76_030635 [Salix suchowensis]|nr:hypothetical protein OIU76_030635 [Salix suchowensis]